MVLADHAPRLRQAGAATLAKPFDVDDLLALVQRLVPGPPAGG